MKLNPPPHVLAVLYLIATFGAPLEALAAAEKWIDRPEQVFVGSVIGIIALLAAGNAVAGATAKTTTDALAENTAALAAVSGKVTALHETVLQTAAKAPRKTPGIPKEL